MKNFNLILFLYAMYITMFLSLDHLLVVLIQMPVNFYSNKNRLNHMVNVVNFID